MLGLRCPAVTREGRSDGSRRSPGMMHRDGETSVVPPSTAQSVSWRRGPSESTHATSHRCLVAP